MVRQVTWTLTLTTAWLTASFASAQGTRNPAPAKNSPAPSATQQPTAGAKKAAPKPLTQEEIARLEAAMEPILAEWEKRSAKVSSLDAAYDYIHHSVGFGNEYYRGRAMLQSPDKACIQNTKKVLADDGKPLVEVDEKGVRRERLEPIPHDRIVCTGTEVIQYTFEKRQIIRHPLEQQAQLKQLQEGPLPFLFNMKSSELKKRYYMRLNQEFAEVYKIDIFPLKSIDADSFDHAVLWLSKKTYLPDKLWLIKKGAKEYDEYVFGGSNNMVLANQTIDEKWFKFQMYKDFQVVVNKQQDVQPIPVNNSSNRAPATRDQATQQTGRANPK